MSTHRLVVVDSKTFPERWRCELCDETFAVYRGTKISSLRHDESGRFFLLGTPPAVIGPSALQCSGRKPDE